MANSSLYDALTYELDDDCFVDGSPTAAPTSTGPTVLDTRPNIIIMQPDDLSFYDPWSPPPNNPNRPNKEIPFPDVGLPWMDKLRKYSFVIRADHLLVKGICFSIINTFLCFNGQVLTACKCCKRMLLLQMRYISFLNNDRLVQSFHLTCWAFKLHLLHAISALSSKASSNVFHPFLLYH